MTNTETLPARGAKPFDRLPEDVQAHIRGQRAALLMVFTRAEKLHPGLVFAGVQNRADVLKRRAKNRVARATRQAQRGSAAAGVLLAVALGALVWVAVLLLLAVAL